MVCFLEHLNELLQPVVKCPFHALIRIFLCVPHKNVISEPFTKPGHESATQETAPMVEKSIGFNRAIHNILEKLLIDMVEKEN